MRRAVSTFAVVVALVLLSGCGLFTKAAATVNGSVITERDLAQELTWMRAVPVYEEAVVRGISVEPGARQRLNDEVVALQLNRLIVFRLIDQEVARRGLEVGDDQRRQAITDTVDQIGSLLGDANVAVEVFNSLPREFRVALVERQAEASVVQASLPSATPTDPQLRAFYEANLPLFEQVCARYVLSDTEDQSRRALARLQQGEDFAKVAAEESTDPNARSTGGDVGCFRRTGVEAIFAGTAFEAVLGEVVGPVEAQPTGWYLIQVYNRMGDSFEEVKAEVAERFSQSGPAIEFQSLIQKLLEEARIDVNARFGRWAPSLRRVVLTETATA